MCQMGLNFYYEGKMFFYYYYFAFIASVLLIIASLYRDVLERRVGGEDSAEAARLLRDDKTAHVSFLILKQGNKNGHTSREMSRPIGKPTICLGENSAFVFATRIVQFLFYLNPKFQASSSFLCSYKPVCVGPGRKPHCWFSHEAAQMYSVLLYRHNSMRNVSHLMQVDGKMVSIPGRH